MTKCLDYAIIIIVNKKGSKYYDKKTTTQTFFTEEEVMLVKDLRKFVLEDELLIWMKENCCEPLYFQYSLDQIENENLKKDIDYLEIDKISIGRSVPDKLFSQFLYVKVKYDKKFCQKYKKYFRRNFIFKNSFESNYFSIKDKE